MESTFTTFSIHSSFFLSLAGAAAVAAIIIYYTLLRRPCSGLPLPPCPFRLPIVGNLPFLNSNLHSYFAHLSSTHGPIFRLHLGSKLAIIITSPSLSRQILRDQDLTFANRDVPAAAAVIFYGGSDIAWSPNGPTWLMLRRIFVQEMLRPTKLDAVHHLRRRELRAAIRQIQSSAVSGKAVDVGAEMFLTLMNTVTSMLWGGTVEGGEERSAVGKEFKELVGEITELLGRPNVSDFLPAIARFDLQGIERKMRVLLERFDGIFNRIIEKKKRLKGVMKDGRNEKEKKDFLDCMLLLEKGGESKEPFTMTHVKALLMDMVVGGTETNSNTIEFAMAEMMNKPEIIKQAQEELDKVVGKEKIVEASHLPNLHYLNMIIKEVLRLHPALPLLAPHCSSSPCSIDGFTVPEGTRVFINVWAIHRDETIWKDPLDFKPERWTDSAATVSEFSYFPFGSGRRICPGISMAEKMILYSLASLLHSFDWKLPQGITEIDLSDKFGIVLKKSKPLVVVPVPRLSNLELYS